MKYSLKLDHLPGHYRNSNELVEKSKAFNQVYEKLKLKKASVIADNVKLEAE
jgi:hypothetical protein